MSSEATLVRPVPSRLMYHALRRVAALLPALTRKAILAPSGETWGYNSLMSGVFVRFTGSDPSALTRKSSQLFSR